MSTPKIDNVKARLADFMFRYDDEVSSLPTFDGCETDEQAAILIERILTILGAAQIELRKCTTVLRSP